MVSTADPEPAVFRLRDYPSDAQILCAMLPPSGDERVIAPVSQKIGFDIADMAVRNLGGFCRPSREQAGQDRPVLVKNGAQMIRLAADQELHAFEIGTDKGDSRPRKLATGHSHRHRMEAHIRAVIDREITDPDGFRLRFQESMKVCASSSAIGGDKAAMAMRSSPARRKIA
ncbi:hypothetical protein [Faunimonas pinastri]|uniref:hypothetical protein n=1 Tax=Faunimonas pinastri TaxID=1855383 RepID=UPI001EEA1C3C|nr:hypothetical protein [Faunimonas pinastri]